MYSKSEIIQYVEENDVKFIKLFFADISGSLKSLTIQPSMLRKAFDEGIAFDGSAIKGFASADRSDLLLVPDASTLSVLPWRPSHGRVARLYCNICYPDGSPFAGDFRYILEKSVEKANKMGYEIQIGTECEFYLFKMDENGMATAIPYDMGSYCDLAPIDRGENVRRDIVLNLEQMGIEPLTSHHENGPGQNEVDFKYDSPIKAADNYFTFRNTVKTIAYKDGVFASFNPKPLEGEAGNGLHINISLRKDGENIFQKNAPEKDYFIAGVLKRIREITAFLNTTPESYKRLGEWEAPRYVSWSSCNRSQLIRIPAAKGEECRCELRSADPVCNLYIGLALVIEAGLEGISNKTELMPSVDINLEKAGEDEIKGLEALPRTLNEALDLAKDSEFVKSVLGNDNLEAYIKNRNEDIDLYLAGREAKSHWFKRWIMF